MSAGALPPSHDAAGGAGDGGSETRELEPAPAPRAGCTTRLVAVGFSLLLALLLAEGALRLTGIAAAGRGSAWFAGGNHPRFLFQPDVASGYTLRPGFHGREVAPGREFDVPDTVDAHGLRDHAHAAPERPAVLALGDSMTFGEGVREEEAWPAVVERRLGVRVYAGGVPGYASTQMVGRLRALLPLLHPALVVVALSPHWDRQRIEEPFVYKDGFIVASGYAAKLHTIDGNLYLADVRWPLVGTLTAHAKRWSHLARLLLPATRRLAGAIAGERRRDPRALPPLPGPTKEALVTMQREAHAAGAGFLVLFLDSRGPEYERARDALLATLRERGIAVVTADALVAPADWPALRFARDRHWNPAGHRAVGEALAPHVERALRSPR